MLNRPSFVAIAAMLSTTTGCFFQTTDPTGGDPTGGDPTQLDIAEYEALQAELEQSRTEFLGETAGEIAGIGTRLFWQDFTNWAPTLQSYNVVDGTRVDYAFSIGPDHEYANYRASEALVVSAELAGDIIYHVYDVADPELEVGSFTLPAPGAGVRWHAYAPDQQDVYVVIADVVEGQTNTQLLKWTVGDVEPRLITTLEEATGTNLGEFWDLGVSGGKAIFIEAGRIWSLDLTTLEATWLENETLAYGAAWDARGVLFPTADGPFYFSYAGTGLRDIAREIEQSSYRLNTTYASIHLYGADSDELPALLGDHVAYRASDGVFTFDMASSTVRPLLLDARDGTVRYRSPVVLEDGSIFVQALESDVIGSTGADGHIYRLNFKL
jgi:hypothetical protein